jgi:hypothetical protein
MTRSGPGAIVLASLAVAGAWAAAWAQPDSASVHKSVYGKLKSVSKSRNAVFMTSDSGEQLAWRFNARIVAELGRFEPGQAMIVIYRQTRSNEKSVTAVAFPGTANGPVYVNMTGERVLLRSGPMLSGACAPAAPDVEVHETSIAAGGMTEISDGCWCCAPEEHTCSPANKSGNGKALLVQCYKTE